MLRALRSRCQQSRAARAPPEKHLRSAMWREGATGSHLSVFVYAPVGRAAVREGVLMAGVLVRRRCGPLHPSRQVATLSRADSSASVATSVRASPFDGALPRLMILIAVGLITRFPLVDDGRPSCIIKTIGGESSLSRLVVTGRLLFD